MKSNDMKTTKFVEEFHYHQQVGIYNQHLLEGQLSSQIRKINYNFLNHFHPYVGYLIERLNKRSVPGLLDINTQQISEEFFKQIYDPNTSDPTLAVKYNNKDIDLTENGPYSVYNWELFFHVPLTIAVHLSKNQRFADAQQWFHFIFNPTSNEKNVDPPERFWNFRTFREKSDVQLIDDMLKALSKPDNESTEKEKELKEKIQLSIEGWRNKPFQPHVIARTRPLAYQFNVVMKYLDNLIAWGDSLFRQDSIETLNEATQIYVLGANILGERPQEVPRRGASKPKTYATLKGKLDAFGNALVEMEGQFPFNQSVPTTENQDTNKSNSLLGVGRTLYFCIPKNDKLLGYWDTVADRLFKIRHCMNIEGIVRQLPLFQPPIDPGMLVKAAAAGIDLNSVVSGLNQPVSTVRSIVLIQRATEICNEVRSLGNALLSAIEKGDGETLSLLRQEQEIKILRLVEDVKFLQWKESESATDSLLRSRETAFQRYQHYQIMLGNKEEDLSDIKELTLERREIDQENFDEIYGEFVGQYASEIELDDYPSKEHLGEGILNLNRNEDDELNNHMPSSRDYQVAASFSDGIGQALVYIPSFEVKLAYWGVGSGMKVSGGQMLSDGAKIVSTSLRGKAGYESEKGSAASRTAGYERRAEDWILQSNLAAKELMQIGIQIISSLIREQITKTEYENHKVQIENAVEIDAFLKEKFSNKELYTWMQGEISKIYYECYKFAYDIAKKTEQTMKHEVMRKELDERDFIKFNYWDTGRKGLLSGEALYLDIKRMEMAYHDHNKREYELTKHFSLRQLDPIALLRFKATGSCEITIPEWLFDLDCPGHYMRRIKTLSVSIPCVVGPYTSVNCTVALQKSTLRKSSLLKDCEYSRDGSEDDRFKDYFGTIQSIVTSNAQNDTGIFELNLRDERFLPFEGAGAESIWKLELPSKYRQFDYDTISDVILHMRYTARQGGASLKEKAEERIKGLVEDASTSGLFRLFSLRHDFPNEWQNFVTSDSDENFKATIKKVYFSYIAQGLDIGIDQIQLLCIKDRNIEAVDSLSIVNNTLDQINDNGEGEIEIIENKLDKKAQVFIVLRYTIT